MPFWRLLALEITPRTQHMRVIEIGARALNGNSKRLVVSFAATALRRVSTVALLPDIFLAGVRYMAVCLFSCHHCFRPMAFHHAASQRDSALTFAAMKRVSPASTASKWCGDKYTAWWLCRRRIISHDTSHLLKEI